jgi:hypothetical protein
VIGARHMRVGPSDQLRPEASISPFVAAVYRWRFKCRWRFKYPAQREWTTPGGA